MCILPVLPPKMPPAPLGPCRCNGPCMCRAKASWRPARSIDPRVPHLTWHWLWTSMLYAFLAAALFGAVFH